MSPFTIPSVGMLLLSLMICTQGEAQDLPVPGTPRGDLPTELLQCRAYCKAIDKSLNEIEELHPSLAIGVAAARASWTTSPFAQGCKAIEKQILDQTKGEGAAMLKEIDREAWKLAEKYLKSPTLPEARDFLQLVHRRAKGEIEVDMVRGNLLWNYPPYQTTPDKEMDAGFTRKVVHTANSGMKIEFLVPMSWKLEPSQKTELMAFKNCYGHGNVWMTVYVAPTVDESGHRISSEEAFAGYSEEQLAADYQRLGITLNSYLETKVNSMPALLFTREQLYEQLGMKATRAAEVIRVFTRGHMISFQINTLGPEGEKVAAIRIKKNQALFKIIGGSLVISDE